MIEKSTEAMPGSFRSPVVLSKLIKLPKKISQAKVPDWIRDWTPFFLVVSYFAVSIRFYLIVPQNIRERIWLLYLIVSTCIFSSSNFESLMSIGPILDSEKAARQLKQNNGIFPTPDEDLGILDVIFVAYLPNEKDIILDRICYALEKIVYPREKLRIFVLYNTPHPIEPLESQLHEMALKHPELQVIKVPNSKSKADNINYYCSLSTGAQVSAIFDCDHYPHPDGPRWAMDRYATDETIDIIQGRNVVFNGSTNLLTAMISTEFDSIYTISNPGRFAMFGLGLFCGSNGYWRTSLLRDLGMDKTMLTEDIDSSLRAFSRSANIVHDINVISYELAPTTIGGFWKQRLRWSQGWCQAGLRHASLILASTKADSKTRSFAQRSGLFALLCVRESGHYISTQQMCLAISLLLLNYSKPWEEIFKALFFQHPLAFWRIVLGYAHISSNSRVITNSATVLFSRRESSVSPCAFARNSSLGG